MVEKGCWLCGKELPEHLDKHHIFGGSNRKNSERYGATVYLHHFTCHEFGERAAHNNVQTSQALHEWGQRRVMLEQGWDVDDWRAVFGRNYLDDDVLADIEETILTHGTGSDLHSVGQGAMVE